VLRFGRGNGCPLINGPDRRLRAALNQPARIEEEELKNAGQDKTPQPLTISAIIPTKNRSADLARTIETLQQQTVQPLELILVDQSPEPTFTRQIPIPIVCIHDPALSGLTAARNASLTVARGDICLFLDDDVLLEPTFIEEILKAYGPNVTGVSGIIKNYSFPPLKQHLWEAIFQIGPFHDERQGIYRNARRLQNEEPIRVGQFGGGLMSFRASAIRGHRFDSNLTGACPGEDIDFCSSLQKDSVLLIAPKARLIHNRSPESRDSTHWISLDAQVSSYMHKRHWRRGLWNNLCYGWLNVGYATAAAFSSLKNRSASPWKAWREGIHKGKQIASGQN
jgi:glycosyltransferase involved in cell wall biosynthesis